MKVKHLKNNVVTFQQVSILHSRLQSFGQFQIAYQITDSDRNCDINSHKYGIQEDSLSVLLFSDCTQTIQPLQHNPH